jgi:ABC-type Na+ transport system ATPase subunit NatA
VVLALLLRLTPLLPCLAASVLPDYPLLTTRETLQFAHDNSHADVSPLQSAELSSLHAKKVDTMLELMGLEECADTIVGNSYIRGISGGQRRRVGVAEMLMGQARALFLDEIRSGSNALAVRCTAVRAHRSLAHVSVCCSRCRCVILFPARDWTPRRRSTSSAR